MCGHVIAEFSRMDRFSKRDGHVIIVSGCLILTAVNLIVLIRMAYITKRLVDCQASQVVQDLL